MKKIYLIILIVFAKNIYSSKIQAQSLPVGTIGIEDYYRRKQLLGEIDSTISFSIRPLFNNMSFNTKNIYDPDSTLNSDSYLKWSGPIPFAKNKGLFQILPIVWQQQYNSHHPYGWNDGPMISARGYQTIVSAGLFAKFGPLSIQLRPEYVFAQNNKFDGFAAAGRSDAELVSYYNFYSQLDAPERVGMKSYSKLNWGQSSVRLTVGPVSFGLSNENLWWGPGVQNALMMTNNAAGFKHLTLNTVKPIKTYIGSFEAQIIAGRLENSNDLPLNPSIFSRQDLFLPYNNDWRYLAGLNISYQPKWVPGLSVGFMRDFVSYGQDVKGFKDYFPFFFPVQKATTATIGDPYGRDQRIGMFARWLFIKAHAEVYFEYGLNDNSYNYRDFLGSPDHGRAYIFGISKMLPIFNRNDEFIHINAEIDQLSQSVDRLVRPAGGFYQHGEVRQGYTNGGQILGAGTGSGGNLQSLEINWVKRLKKIGVNFQRFEHNADFYDQYILDYNGQSRRWVDFAIAANGSWNYKNLIFNAKLQGIKSLNYQWQLKDFVDDLYYIPNNDVINIHGELGVTFRF
jgi:hypothetical protein